VLSEYDLSLLALTGEETATGYMRWYFNISHPHITPHPKNVHILMPAEQKTLNKVVVEE